MNNRNIFEMLGAGIVVFFLICVGIFLYVEWDLKRFESSLKTPRVVSQGPVSQKDMPIEKDFGKITPSEPAAPEISEEQRIEQDELELTELDSSEDVIESEFDKSSVSKVEFSEDFLSDSIDVPATTEQENKKIDRKAAVADYNKFLTTDPEYAYARLADVFRADFGDVPEVDILVESVRKANNGPLTVNEDLAWQEAILRTLPPNESMMASMVLEKIASLKKLQEFERMGGEPIKITYGKITIR